MSLDQAPASSELLGMSDDKIMDMVAPPEAGAAPVNDPEEDKVEAAAETVVEEEKSPAEADSVDQGEGGEADGTNSEAVAATEDKDKAPEGAADQAEKPDASTGSEGVIEGTPEQAQAFFQQIMTPFKANGRMIQPKSAEEVIQLMQMGANYTRKLQDISKHRKTLLMLENNGLLDEGKLSFLIDLDKRNPEAIKKLIKDAGIDPMDIDTNVEPTYSEGNHVVSDEEAGFRTVLDELTSSEVGQETIRFINTDWDQASKEALWKSPEIMTIIHEQRESGVYDLIKAEVDRKITLGQILPTTPFLQAYHQVGQELAAAGTIGDQKVKKDEPVVVATTKATPKSPVKNGEQANAASPTRTTPRKAEKLINPLAMSDEEILKLDNFEGRV